jgi:hypothetical protein
VWAEGASNEAPRVRVVTVVTVPKMNAIFHNSKSWLGSDCAYSFKLDNGDNLWWFGDTFISAKTDGKPQTMINNSIGFLHGPVSDAHFEFHWGSRGGGAPESQSRSPHEHEWYWPGDGAVIGEHLYMFMKRVRSRHDPKAGAFNFEDAGDDLVRFVSSQNGSPPILEQCTPVAAPDEDILFGAACTQDEHYFYSYCSSRKDATGLDAHPCVIARIEKSRLDNCTLSDWQYWNETGKTWSSSRDQASILFADAAPEMTVSFLKGWNLYIAIYMPPLSSKIIMRTAARPEGPFSPPTEIYKCPETETIVNGNRVMVYSAKAHPELSPTPDDLFVTYCSNPGDLKNFVVRPDLYSPHFLRLRLSREVR